MIGVPERELVEVATTTKAPTIPVAETYGPTIEGEGPWAGTPTYFLRIGGCDFKCLWCDTDHAVLVEKVRGLPRFSQAQIWENLRKYTIEHPGPDVLAISGGNPGLYDLSDIVSEWQHSEPHGIKERRVIVETQGSRWQPWFGEVNLLTVSPKPPSSGMTNDGLDAFMEAVGESEEYWSPFLATGQELPDRWQMIFKVVVFDEADYQFARDLHQRWPLVPFYLSTGTAMGGLTGKWVPPPIPDLKEDASDRAEYDRYKQVRRFPDTQWVSSMYVDEPWYLLRRYRWLAERAMNDTAMADAVVGVQLHCLLWGITTKGV